jgi:hypothetical protein
VFCYFAGLWIVASRFGLVKLMTRYGISEIFDEIPKDFPNMKYLYYGLLIYTILYAIVCYVIYKYVSKATEEQEVVQQQVAEVTNFAEQTNVLLSSYVRYAKENEIADKTAEQKLRLVQRQIAALPAGIAATPSAKSSITNIISELRDQLSSGFDYHLFCTTLDSAIDEINSLKRKSVNIH